MAVASAGPYADNHDSTPPLSFIEAGWLRSLTKMVKDQLVR